MAVQRMSIGFPTGPLDTGETIFSDPGARGVPAERPEEPDMHDDTPRRLIGFLDLTELSDDTNETAIARLCETARGGDDVPACAAVCVPIPFVASAKRALSGSGVRVATVVDFPGGRGSREEVVAQTLRALAEGADEIDYVFAHERFRDGERELAGSLVRAVRAVSGDTPLKVILETGVLDDPWAIADATRIAIVNGADFVKTSTGRTPVCATPEAVETMARVVRDLATATGIKASGGIRTLETARHLLEIVETRLGPVDKSRFRIGASSLHGSLVAALRGRADTTGATSAY